MSRGEGRVDVAAPISDVIRRRGELSPKEFGRQVMERLRATDRAEAYMRRRKWVKHILYNRGEQRLRWDPASRGFIRPPKNKRVQRHEANLLGVRGDHWTADVTQAMPFFSGTPENTDLESRSIAKLAEHRVIAYWRELNLDLARTLVTRDIWTCGGGFIEAGWNPYGGPVVAKYAKKGRDSTGFPIYEMDGEGRPVLEGYERLGEAYAHEVSPLLVYVPPTTDRPQMEAAAWVARLEWATEEQIRDIAGDRLPADWTFTDDPEFSYVDNAIDLSTDRHTRDEEQSGLHLLVHYYQLRSDVGGYDRGCHAIVTGDMLISECEPLEGEGDRYPLFYFGGRTRERKFWCHPEIEDRVASQKQRNDVKTHILNWLGRYALPNLIAQKGSEVPEHYGMYGETIFYSPAYQPPQVQHPPAPSPALIAMLNASTEEFDETGGDPPGSRGVAVTAPSGSYLNLLQDAAAKRYGPIVRQHAWSWARFGEYLCQISAARETDEQILSVVGRGNRSELVRMRGVKRLGGVKFYVHESSLVSALPAARVSQLVELASTGVLDRIIGPPPWNGAIRRSLIDFASMPALSEVELGSGLLDRWTSAILTRLIEEGQEVTELDPLMDGPDAEALLEALNMRKLESDRYEWDDQTVARVGQLKMLLEQRLEEEKQNAMKTQKEAMGVAAEGELIVSRGEAAARAKEKSAVAFAKARADVIKDLAAPPPPPPMQGQAPAREGGSTHGA